MTTIRDVAKLAGVAPITVSRVVNDSGYVSEPTRERVEKAIAKLGYVPNMLGPSLRFKQTNTLALVLTDITNPFWTTVARGVEDAANEARYNVIFCNTDESEDKQENYLTMLLKRQIDGILLVPARSTPGPLLFMHKQHVPVVVLDRQVPFEEVDVVRGDSEGGAYQLTRHLQSLGHERIVLLAGPKAVSTANDRVIGYRRAKAETGNEDCTSNIFWGDFTQTAGYDMTIQALASVPQLTAIFAGNNFMALGAMRALADAGLRVPEDVTLVAFDDFHPGLTSDPFLTVAIQPAYEMGYQATQLLLDRLSGHAPQEYQQIILPTEIIVRKSSAKPKAESVKKGTESAKLTPGLKNASKNTGFRKGVTSEYGSG